MMQRIPACAYGYVAVNVCMSMHTSNAQKDMHGMLVGMYTTFLNILRSAKQQLVNSTSTVNSMVCVDLQLTQVLR